MSSSILSRLASGRSGVLSIISPFARGANSTLPGSATGAAVGGGGGGLWGGNCYQAIAWKHGPKPVQAAKKRFRLLRGGLIMRGKAGQRHNTGYRSTDRMSRLRVTAPVHASFAKSIRKLITG